MSSFQAWFPQAKQTKTGAPRLRIVAFPNAGSAENVYTGQDKTAFRGLTGRRDNALMAWAKQTKVEIYAAQPPGRDLRMKEPALETAALIARGAYDALVSQNPSFFADDAPPFAVMGHSMGTWVAYEFLKVLASEAKSQKKPTLLLLSGFPSPSLPENERPWTRQSLLPKKEEFQAECRAWDVNEAVFAEGMWAMYEPLLRADFKCFDEYPGIIVADEAEKNALKEGNSLLFGVPVKAFFAAKDKRATKATVATWGDVAADFELMEPAVQGNHLFFYDEPARAAFFERAAAQFEAAQPPMVFACEARKGAAVRAGCELTSALLEPELQDGWLVKVTSEARNAKGTDRLHVVAYAEHDKAPYRPLDAWASKKLFKFKKWDDPLTTSSSEPYEETKEEPRAAQRQQEQQKPVGPMPSAGTRRVVVGKSGAMLRAGPEMDTADLNVTLESGTEVWVVEERVNVKGSLRARLGRYADQTTGTYVGLDGWCTAKFLSLPASGAGKTTTTEPLPNVGAPVPVVAPPSAAGYVVLFPGQGAQKVGMMTPYLDAPGVRAMFALASQAFDGEDLLDVIQSGPETKLNDTRYSQVCVFLTSLAAVYKAAADDPTLLAKADVCAGFSLGEYTALAFAGVLDLKTAIALLKVRGAAMGDACASSGSDAVETGMMTVVGLETDQLETVMASAPDVSVANQLFPKGRVLSGPKADLKRLEADVKALNVAGSKTIVQPVSGAFHSKYMRPAADKLRAALEDATFHPPTRTVYSNVNARPHSAVAADIKAKMVEQLTAGVLWEDTVRHIEATYPNTEKFFEPAPGRQLSSMMKRINIENMPKMNNV